MDFTDKKKLASTVQTVFNTYKFVGSAAYELTDKKTGNKMYIECSTMVRGKLEKVALKEGYEVSPQVVPFYKEIKIEE